MSTQVAVKSATAHRAASAADAADAAAKASADRKQAEMMTSLMEVMWRICVVDVEATLRAACHKVLYDHAVDRDTRLGRARALERLGAAFAKHAAGRDETWQESLAKTVGEAVAHPQPADDGPPPGGAA